MTAKKGWEKSTSGPDWIDVETMMRALEALHSGHVAVIVSPAGTGSSGGVDVCCSMLLDVLPGSALPSAISSSAPWPCSQCATLAQHAYHGLHTLDHEIGKVYKNEELWK